MNSQDFGDDRVPSRWPGILVVLLAVGGFFCARQCGWFKPSAAPTEVTALVPATNLPPVEILKPVAVPNEPPTPVGKKKETGKTAVRAATNKVAKAVPPVSAVATNPVASAKPAVPPATASAGGAPVNVTAAIQDANRKTQAGDLAGARTALQGVWKQSSGKDREQIEGLLGHLNLSMITNAAAMPEKVDYSVKNGDSLDKIAKRFGTTKDLIQISNGIRNAALIRAGDRLRVLNGKLSIEVSKSRNDLVLYMNGEFVKRYHVGTGKFGKTPVGKFVIDDKIEKPAWWRPDGKKVEFTGKSDGENILGTRWMHLQAIEGTDPAAGYGIHGTWDDASIGKAESAGCVRMHNPEVEELFMLVPVGTPVKIEE